MSDDIPYPPSGTVAPLSAVDFCKVSSHDFSMGYRGPYTVREGRRFCDICGAEVVGYDEWQQHEFEKTVARLRQDKWDNNPLVKALDRMLGGRK